MFTRGSAITRERGLQRSQLKGGAHSFGYGRRLQAGRLVTHAPREGATPVNVYRKALVRSWWVFLFALLCYGAYDLANSRQQAERVALTQAIGESQRLCASLEQEISEMEERLTAHDDPALMEQVLMARLGLVPKGQIKAVVRK